MNIIIYIIFFIFIITFLYIRLKYRFWVYQPVFHFYDIYYWFINIGIIRHELPSKNKYTNFINIETIDLNNISDVYINKFLSLIQLNYLRNKENKYFPKKNNVIPYFTNHNMKSFWSFYWQNELLINNKNNQTIEDKKLIGVITSRPLVVKIIRNNKENNFNIYYVDYLCVHKSYRKQNIAPQLIQTHEYQQCHKNQQICISLFKREEELTGIVPLTVYKTYCFNMYKWNEPSALEPFIKIVKGDSQNMYYVYNFINTIKKKYDILIYPEISNLLELVSSKNIFINIVFINGDIQAIYVFKKTCTYIEKDKEIISCICSIRNDEILSLDNFIKAFKMSLWTIKNDFNNFNYLTIENISDNNSIIKNLLIKTHPVAISHMAYFFYNFAYSTFNSNKCFIIN